MPAAKNPVRKKPDSKKKSGPRHAGPTDSVKPARPPRRRVGVEGQRVTVLMGALKVLENKSYEQLSVEDVLQTAGVSRQTFYRCFRNKNELFHQIFRDGNTMFLTAIRSLDKSGSDPMSVADRALTGGLMFVIHGGGALRALYRETIKIDGEFAPYRKEVLDTLVGEITTWASELRGAPVDSLLVRVVLLSIEQLTFEMAAHGTPSNDELQRFRGIVRTLVNGVWQELSRQQAADKA